ncbi:MAG TPA: Crp/Fnr family transcriptional regulator [Rhizomicrobium sp.]|jgi:CRP/FNR family cyclic AMP-dependent transcriptional regulator|nr:Crp/Fnr family transcriptional regulator [Rhizomicrobium sp.]
MHLVDVAGYVAAVLVFLTFYMKTMIPLRLVGICSNCVFIIYAYFGTLYPVLILHIILLPLNLLRLREMLRLTKQVSAATRADLSMDWLKPFTSTRQLETGDVLFRKGDRANAMFFIVSGAYRLVEIGVQLPQGQVVGELGLLAPDQARTQTLECTASGEVLQITYEQVKQLYYQNPQFGFYFLQLTTKRLFENIAHLERELATKGSSVASPA